ncbi:MAG: hypothetical protein HW416_677 [Chloroflexi bacterium]|nr:hypothetical protein [Chloroflexota bacterium]
MIKFPFGTTAAVLTNLAFRGALLYFGTEAIKVTATDPGDRRFEGKGIAARNALLIGGFSLLLPVLYAVGARQRAFPWVSDAIFVSIPFLDMAGNSFDLYNRYGPFDSITHFYGNFAAAALMTLVLDGDAAHPRVARLLTASATVSFFHLLLEMQEYWTDELFGTHNVEGILDVEGDLLSGMMGTLTGVAVAATMLSSNIGDLIRAESVRLRATLQPILSPTDGRNPPR